MFLKLGRGRVVTSKEDEILNLLSEFQVCLPPRRCSGTPATLSRGEESQSLRIETAKAANVGSLAPTREEDEGLRSLHGVRGIPLRWVNPKCDSG